MYKRQTLDEPLARAVFEAYEKDTGVKVEWVRLSTGEAVARMEAERKNPQVDIWYGGVGLGHIEAKLKDLTIPYVSPNAKNIPDKFKDPDGYWTGIYAGALCFVSNINRLEELGVEAPTSWADALKPEFEGHIQIDVYKRQEFRLPTNRLATIPLGAVAFSKVNVIEYDVTWAAVNKDYLLDEWISATGDAGGE